MGTTLNRTAYQRLIDENLAWLDQQPRTLEREHIKDIVRLSPSREYYVHDRLDKIAHCETGMCTHCVELLCEAIDTLRPARRESNAQDLEGIPTTMKPRPAGAMAVIIKDTSMLSGTIGNNVAALMTKTLHAADNPDMLGYQESLATCLMLALFEVFGVPAHSKMPAPEMIQEVLTRMAVEFGLDADTFTIKFWDTESESEKPS